MKKSIRTVITLVLALIMICSLAACGGGKDSGGEILKVGIGAEPTSLDPHACGTFGGVICNALYDTLIFYDSNTGEYKPHVATKWEVIDETTTRYYLRKDVKAHDGTILTANDVLYTFKRGMENPESVTNYKIYDIENFVIVDEYTIDIKTFEPNANAFSNLSTTDFALIDESSSIAAGGPDSSITAPANGTGPYKFVEWKAGEYCLIERNDDYWGEKGYYKQIQIRFITDETTRTLSLEAGDVNVITGVSAAQADTISANDNLKVIEQTSKNAVVACINTKSDNEALGNLKVRQAIAHAINKEAIITIANEGYGTVLDTPVSKANPLSVELGDKYKYEYNPERAKQLLAEAGYGDGLTIELLYYASNQLVAEVLQNNLKEIGITLELNCSEVWADINETGDFDILLCTFFGRSNTQIFGLMDNRINYKDRNHCAFGDDSYNADLDALYQAANPSTVLTESQRLMESFMENIPAVGICSTNYLFAATKDLDGFYCCTGLDQLLVHKIHPAQ